VRMAAGAVATIGVWAAYTQTPQQPRPPLTIEKVKDDPPENWHPGDMGPRCHLAVP